MAKQSFFEFLLEAVVTVIIVIILAVALGPVLAQLNPYSAALFYIFIVMIVGAIIYAVYTRVQG